MIFFSNAHLVTVASLCPSYGKRWQGLEKYSCVGFFLFIHLSVSPHFLNTLSLIVCLIFVLLSLASVMFVCLYTNKTIPKNMPFNFKWCFFCSFCLGRKYCCQKILQHRNLLSLSKQCSVSKNKKHPYPSFLPSSLCVFTDEAFTVVIHLSAVTGFP